MNEFNNDFDHIEPMTLESYEEQYSEAFNRVDDFIVSLNVDVADEDFQHLVRNDMSENEIKDFLIEKDYLPF
ncbi:MAG: hypothetical protein U9N49_10175 [Campylobacterota bacterium]|nr:hypothetical protein [Campylobacterota bacterium]